MNRLKELRKEKGLTYEKLAEKTDISSKQLSRYEREEQTPKKETWEKLANYFNVPIPYIMGFESKAEFEFHQRMEQRFSETEDIHEKKFKKIIDEVESSVKSSIGNERFLKIIQDFNKENKRQYLSEFENLFKVQNKEEEELMLFFHLLSKSDKEKALNFIKNLDFSAQETYSKK